MADGGEEVLPGIAETLAGAHVFITGATGFLGKAVVEKLLRSVPDLGGLYILARAKRDVSARDRVDKLFAGSVSCLASCLFSFLASSNRVSSYVQNVLVRTFFSPRLSCLCWPVSSGFFLCILAVALCVAFFFPLQLVVPAFVFKLKK